MNSPVKEEPVLVAETAVESHKIGGYCQIVKMKDEWWMYYNAMPLGDFNYDASRADGTGYMVCLATSKDGLEWQRKNVSLYPIRGKENNVVIPNAYGYMFDDPKKSDGYPYWFLTHMQECAVWKEADGCDYWDGLYLLKSKDGIHWKRHPGMALPFHMDSWNQCFYDSPLQKYVAYVRSWVPGKDRCVSRLEFEDLLSFPWPHETYDPNRKRVRKNKLLDEIPVVMQAGPDDPPGMDLYTSCVEPYGSAHPVWLAFPSRYRHYDSFYSFGRDSRGKNENVGVLDVALSVSLDGINWRRFSEAYVPLGMIGKIDAGSLYMGMGMIIKEDEIWQYCGVLSDRASYYRMDQGVGAIIRLVQRLDGFVSADTDHKGGELTTPLLVFEGNRLDLNIDCGAMGEAWVEIKNSEGKPIPGYSMEESVSVDRNGIAQKVWWQKGPDVSELAGQTIRLHVKMRSAKLYAFQFIKS